ncbi:MAG: hypothetical protein ACREEM_35790, partial [Blastocatellia bacterium]
MIFRWLQISRYHNLVLFLAMGGFGALFAWNSFNLVSLSMANYRYISVFGVMALMEGGLRQTVSLILSGFLSLAFYLGFKACEVELVARWRDIRGQ